MILNPDKKELNLRRMEIPERREATTFSTHIRDLCRRYPTNTALEQLAEFAELGSPRTMDEFEFMYVSEAFLWCARTIERQRGEQYIAIWALRELSGDPNDEDTGTTDMLSECIKRWGLVSTLTLCGLAGKLAEPILTRLHSGGEFGASEYDDAADGSLMYFDDTQGRWMSREQNNEGETELHDTGFRTDFADVFAEVNAGSPDRARQHFEQLLHSPAWQDEVNGESLPLFHTDQDVHYQAIILQAQWNKSAAIQELKRARERYDRPTTEISVIERSLWDLLAEEAVTDHTPPLPEIIPTQPLKKAV